MLNTSAVTQCQQNFNSLPHAEVDGCELFASLGLIRISTHYLTQR